MGIQTYSNSTHKTGARFLFSSACCAERFGQKGILMVSYLNHYNVPLSTHNVKSLSDSLTAFELVNSFLSISLSLKLDAQKENWLLHIVFMPIIFRRLPFHYRFLALLFLFCVVDHSMFSSFQNHVSGFFLSKLTLKPTEVAIDPWKR